MAEFKLGRIKFVWKNDWQQNTTYYKDDVVRFGARVYMCVEGHTSSTNFNNDFNIVPPKWNVASDGQSWKGDWTTSTEYLPNDIVKYGANLYIANTLHTSTNDAALGLENDIANWDLFGTGSDWQNAWTISTRYKVNDLVKYGANLYICKTAHTSTSDIALGLENDIANWDLYNQSLEFKGEWQTATRYKINDIIKYGANLFRVNAPHTSNTFTGDASYLDSFVEGIKFENLWDDGKLYQPGDIVAYGGNQYIAVTQNINVLPSSSETDWSIFSKGFAFRGAWGEDSSLQDYRPGDVVNVGAYIYVATDDSQNKEPGRAADWADYWDRLSEGFNWRGDWVDDQYYVSGDVVRFNNSSYVCIKSHISEGDDFSTETATAPGGGAQNSRPDQDITGQFWNIIVVGSETDVLNTKGDLVYYGASGPTRLPVGDDGQILRVSAEGIPEWTFYGQNTDVYYVSTTGVDTPAPVRGSTLEAPWKSIRYACQQIDEGTKNKNAKKLLELNRIFIQRETTEWTHYQIANNLTPFTTSFNFNATKCERDVGLIIDAIMYDITHGGNTKTREAAISYVNDTVGSPYLGQKTETVASLNYSLTVMTSVLEQNDPATNYQNLNGDLSTAVIVQYKNENIVAESVLSQITALMKIITDTITAGDITNLPEEILVQTLIRVATGIYKEVLPIQVPAYCCILGDELRSTNVQPRKEPAELTPRKDGKYSYTALDRLENIIGDVVTGTTVLATQGNNEAQVQETWPVGEPEQEAAAIQLARVNKRFIDWRLGEKIEVEFPKDYAMTTPELGYARDNILRNRYFIQAEIEAYIDSLIEDGTYPDLHYSRTKCKQDVGYIIDAMAYDLSYDGNWQIINAGIAYYNGNTAQLQIDTSERAATIDAYGYLRSLMVDISKNVTIASPYNTTETQIYGTNAGTAAISSSRITPLMDTFILIVTDYANIPAVTYPDITTAPAQQQTDYTTLQNNYDAIGEQVIDFINSNFGTFKYRSEYCRRDLGYLSDAAYFDAALGTNFWGIYNGYSYNRISSVKVITDQKEQEAGAISYLKELVATSLASDSTAVSRANATYTAVLDILTYGDSQAPVLTFTAPTGGIVDRTDARELLINNKALIRQNVANNLQSLSTTYLNYPQSKKDEIDVEILRTVESLAFDIQYDQTVGATGCNIATRNRARAQWNNITGNSIWEDAADRTFAQLMYSQIGAIAEDVILGTYVGQNTTTTSTTLATSNESNKALALIGIINNILSNNDITLLAAEILPETTWAAAGIQTAIADLQTDRTSNINATLQYITDTYSGFVYNHAKCTRDLTLIVDAAAYDWCLGANFASLQTAISYLRRPSQKVIGDQKDATIAANIYARDLMLPLISDPTAISKLTDAFTFVNDMIFIGSTEAHNRSVENVDNFAAIRNLELNKEFIVEELTNYVDNYFKGVVTQVVAGTGGNIQVDDTSWMTEGMEIKFLNAEDSTEDISVHGLSTDVVYTISEITSSTDIVINTGGATLLQTSNQFIVKSAYEYNRDLCKRDIRTIVDAMKWDLQYPKQFKRRYQTTSVLRTYDFDFYIPANYKTKYTSRYYVNSVIGSQEEDMYYLRNATGIRLQTVDGLDGDLSPENEFGTRRPTAGAYCSLDPGWGPDDESVWIMTRSPYVQNVTTFGHAAIGQKIDGDLHNGGNDSIVSNDFTQVISDGIGAWITNNGRAELVSVFTYYAHIGYLAEAGGRIRATNGNNSYGTFGAVAEGVDVTETPVTGIVDNKFQFVATVSNVETTGDEWIAVEFNHAGNNYTEAQIDIFGNGINAETFANEFRDGAVNRVRIKDSGLDNDGRLGGSNYTVASNTAQAGTYVVSNGVVTSCTITIAATDGNPDSAYPGMRIVIIGGTGVGQYGTIGSYSSGAKFATIYKNDGTLGWEHLMPGTPIVSANAASIYQIEPKVEFSSPVNSSEVGALSSAQNTHDMIYATTADVYTNISVDDTGTSGSGATFDITRNGSKYLVSLNLAGIGYERLGPIKILGSNVGGVDGINDITITPTTIGSNGSIIDFDAEGIGLAGEWISVGISGSPFDVLVQKSTDGITWTSSNLGGDPANVEFSVKIANGLVDDGSTTARTPVTVIAANSASANQIWYSNDNNNTWLVTSLPNGPRAAKPHLVYDNNNFYLMFDGINALYVSGDGGNWTEYATTFGFTAGSPAAMAAGAGRVVVFNTAAAEASYADDSDLDTWTVTTIPTTSAWTSSTFGKNRFIAISDNDNKATVSIDRGETWQEVDMPDQDGSSINNYNFVKYGQGQFVATATFAGVTSFNTVYTSLDGITWTNEGLLPPTSGTNEGYIALAFGNPNQNPVWYFKNYVASGITATPLTIAKLGVTAIGRAGVANQQIFEVRLIEPGSGYTSAPTVTITDPGHIYDVVVEARLGNGSLANPTKINGGIGYISASAEINKLASNGYADFYQSGIFVAVRQLTERPTPGSNVIFDGDSTTYKLVNTVTFLGNNDGSYTAFLNLSPEMEVANSPEHGTPVTMRIRFSQARLTGHDFLDIGTGNFINTNYPNLPLQDPNQENETRQANGGRVFYTATDQDGNFRVGDLFSVEQSTGIATLNADAFNLAGLQELTLGTVTLGGNSASITEFSTDAFMTANSDTVVPTQRAIKAYIEAQIGGGGASLNVNTITAGDIFIGTNTITNVEGTTIYINATTEFKSPVIGYPIAVNYFLR